MEKEISKILVRMPQSLKGAFIGHNDLIDFIGNRCCQFICCRQNTPIAISIFHINQCIGHFCNLLFYTPDKKDGGPLVKR